MRRPRYIPVLFCLCIAAFLGGCLFESDPPAPTDPAVLTGDYAPIRVGNAWVYKRIHSHYTSLFDIYLDSTLVEVKIESIIPAAGGDSVILAVHAEGAAIHKKDNQVFDTLAIDTLFRRAYLDSNGQLEGWNWDAATPNLFFRHFLRSDETDNRLYSPPNSSGPQDFAAAKVVEGEWNGARTWLLEAGRSKVYPPSNLFLSRSWTYAAGVGLVKSRHTHSAVICCTLDDDEWVLVSFTPAPP